MTIAVNDPAGLACIYFFLSEDRDYTADQVII
jgi:hypothetical protein